MTTPAPFPSSRIALLLFFLVLCSGAPTLAQIKLVPMDCPWEDWACDAPMFVEEGTPQPLVDCLAMFDRVNELKVYTKGRIRFEYLHDTSSIREFNALVRGAPIDSSKFYLLSEGMRDIIQLLRDSVGMYSILPGIAAIRCEGSYSFF